jgi:hypothetical protein
LNIREEIEALDFHHHPSFEAELNKFLKRHCHGEETGESVIKYTQNLLTSYFEKRCSISPDHLGLAPGFGEYPIYFYHLIIPNSGLKRTQYPKSYFYKQDTLISLLCCDSHLNGYKDAQLRDIAKKRLYEMLEP